MPVTCIRCGLGRLRGLGYSPLLRTPLNRFIFSPLGFQKVRKHARNFLLGHTPNAAETNMRYSHVLPNFGIQKGETCLLCISVAPPTEDGRMKTKNDPHRRTDEGLEVGSGGRIRTYDLWVMSPASYRAAPPRVEMTSIICA